MTPNDFLVRFYETAPPEVQLMYNVTKNNYSDSHEGTKLNKPDIFFILKNK